MKGTGEQSLKDSELRYRRLFEAAQDGILILDAETGMIEDVNPFLIKMLGYSREEFIKKKLWEVGAFKDVEASQEAFEALQENEYIRYEDLPLKAKDGRLIQVEFVSNVYLVGSEKVIQCNIRDITAHRRAENALRKSEESYQNTLESMIEGCQIIGYDWRYLFINNSAVRQGKLKREELLGHAMTECYPGIEKTDLFAALRRCMDERTSQTIVNEFKYPDDSKGWFELSIQPSPNGIFILSSDITERKRAEEALSESRAQLAGIIDAAMSAIITAGADQRILGFNLAAEKMFGYPAALAIGQPIALLLPNRFRGTQREQFAGFGDDGKTTRTIENIPTLAGVRANGEEFPVEISISRVEVAGKRLYTAIVRDITERKQAEEALRRSEEKYRDLVNALNDGVFVSDDRGVLTFANQALARIHGFEHPEELVGRTFIEFVAPAMAENIAQVFRESIQSGTTAETIEVEIIRADGIGGFIEIKPVSIVEGGKVIGIRGVVRDITERKQREEQMTRLNMAVNNSGEAIFMTDRKGVITFVNPGFTQLYGHTADEIVGKTTPRLLKSGVMKSEDYAAFWQILLNKQVAKGELTNKMKDGALLNIESWSSPILNQQEEVIGFLSLQRDITQRKQREEEIRSRTDEAATLYQLSRALADANDLENVLQIIIRYAVESVHTTVACIALLEDGELVTRAVYPVRNLDHELNTGSRRPITALPYCQRVLEQNEPVILQAASPEIGSFERSTLLLDFVQSVCLVPLRVGDPSQHLNQALGLLILGEAREIKREPFTQEKVHLARSIGDQAASAILRMLLREETERRLQHLSALSEIDRAITSGFDLNISIETILTQVIKQLHVDAANVLLLNSSLQTLEFFCGQGFRTKAIEDVHLHLGESHAGRAALERVLIHVSNLQDPSNGFLRNHLADEDFVSYHGAPLIAKGQVKGVLEIFNRTPFKPDDEWLGFLKALAEQAAIAIDNAMLFDSLTRSNIELSLAYNDTIEGWSRALDLRDKETEGHSMRVAENTVLLARSFGLEDDELAHIDRGALLHDIGKMGIPDNVLLKPGPLTDEEWVVMKRHPRLAYDMLSPIRYLHRALDIPYCHHEKWDGTGYPRGLIGEQIPLSARIFAVVDVWDALNSDRPYRVAWPEEKVLDYIRSLAGTHFDPQVVKICLEPGLLKGHPKRRM